MKMFSTFLLIIFLAFSGYHLSFRGLKLPLFARKFYLTGTEFLFLGLLIGPQFLNLMDTKTYAGLEPLTTFLLGWIGLLYGFQFEINKLRRYPIEYLMATFLDGLVTSSLVFAGVCIVCLFFFKFSMSYALIISLMLSAAASCTAQTGMALISSDVTSRKKKLIAFLKYMSAIDGISAMLILGVVFLLRPLIVETDIGMLSQGINTVIVICLFVSLLALFGLFLLGRLVEEEMVLVVIGMVVITGGSAAILHFSPLLANFMLGVFLANLTRNKERIFNMLVGIEKPVYLLTLIFLGVNWHAHSGWFFVLAAGYAILRAVGKFAGGYSLRFLGAELQQFPPFLGLGLLAPGGLTLAILLDFQQGFPMEISSLILSIALPAIIYSDVMSPHVLTKVVQQDSPR